MSQDAYRNSIYPGPSAQARRVAGNTQSKGQAAVTAEARRATARLEEHRREIEGRATAPTVEILDPRRKLRLHGSCSYCGGTLFNVNVPGLDVDNPVRIRGEVTCQMCGRIVCHLVLGPPPKKTTELTHEELHPRRGRPPKNPPQPGDWIRR